MKTPWEWRESKYSMEILCKLHKYHQFETIFHSNETRYFTQLTTLIVYPRRFLILKLAGNCQSWCSNEPNLKFLKIEVLWCG